MLDAFDRFLHRWLFRPIATWIQRWFHVNRYHLLVATGVINVTVNLFNLAQVVLQVAEDGWSPRTAMLLALVVIMLGGWVGTGYVMVYARALLAAARRFEQSGFQQRSVELVQHAMLAKTIRPFVNVVTPIVALNMLMEWTFPEVLGASTLDAILLQVQHAGTFVFVFDLHLWDVDDLDSRDREYLFGPQSQDA